MILVPAARQKKASSYNSYVMKNLDVHEDWAVFIFYTWNYTMFMQSFKSLVYNGFDEKIIVIDNSDGCEAANDIFVINHSLEVVPLLTQHTFTQV